MATPKYDFESLLVDIKAILTTNLNTQIAAINSEKADDITLASISADAYAMQSMDGAILNFDPFVFIGVGDIEDRIEMGRSSSALSVAILIAKADEGQDTEIWRRMFRYQRALRDIFEEHFEVDAGAVKLSISSQVPVELALLNSSFSHKAIGVLVRAELG